MVKHNENERCQYNNNSKQFNSKLENSSKNVVSPNSKTKKRKFSFLKEDVYPTKLEGQIDKTEKNNISYEKCQLKTDSKTHPKKAINNGIIHKQYNKRNSVLDIEDIHEKIAVESEEEKYSTRSNHKDRKSASENNFLNEDSIKKASSSPKYKKASFRHAESKFQFDCEGNMVAKTISPLKKMKRSKLMEYFRRIVKNKIIIILRFFKVLNEQYEVDNRQFKERHFYLYQDISSDKSSIQAYLEQSVKEEEKLKNDVLKNYYSSDRKEEKKKCCTKRLFFCLSKSRDDNDENKYQYKGKPFFVF